jgi:hypothetical protein
MIADDSQLRRVPLADRVNGSRLAGEYDEERT